MGSRIHTPRMGSPFPIVHAEWSLVFWSIRIMLCCVEKDYFKLNNNSSTHNEAILALVGSSTYRSLSYIGNLDSKLYPVLSVENCRVG